MEEAVTLFENAMESCTLLEPRRVSDGEGGFATVFAPTAKFEAAFALDSSSGARIAEKMGAEDLYTVTTKAPLRYHDAFVRDRDQQVFRSTSNGADRTPPKSATFAFYRHSAEKWELPGSIQEAADE